MDNPLESPVLKGLEKYRKRSKLRFHMPGHKGRMPQEFELLWKNLYSYDVTELEDTDDLYYPGSFLSQSLKDIAKDRKAKESFYLVNGSTVGILSAVLGLLHPGDKILMESGCHKSVHNAAKLGNLKKIILKQPLHLNGFPLPLSEEKIIEALDQEQDIKMVFLTRPNYYGYAGKIEKLVSYCQKKGIYTIIDEAHGSHFVYSPLFPKSAMEAGCSVSINSFHKTMPSFTQTAVLNIGNLCEEDISNIRTTLQMLQTSSPSFLFIASMDLAFRYLKKYREKYDLLYGYIQNLIKNTEDNNYFSISADENKDFTRILIFSKENTVKLLSYLESQGIYAEMHDENTIVLISTIVEEEKDFLYLTEMLNAYSGEELKIPSSLSVEKGRGIPIEKCEGKILLEDIYIYPPGSLYLEKGTLLEKSHLQKLLHMRKQKIRLHKNISRNDDLLYVNIDK